ncbi:hypothetical protein Leryth_001349 [Lithospermum erythrorhizon]|nr:hypothetical protein Leryth_001349 [Lithospermum erythrorhizon]
MVLFVFFHSFLELHVIDPLIYKSPLGGGAYLLKKGGGEGPEANCLHLPRRLGFRHHHQFGNNKCSSQVKLFAIKCRATS